jgi:DNA-binding MarR family transcriptional regulator
MEKLLIEFINTLDGSLKKVQRDAGSSAGVSKLTISQFQYIDAIDGLGTPTITDIANRLKITKASVTTGINRLIALGYVVKTQSEEDKRVFHVSLSKAGGELVQAKYQALKEYEEIMLSALSAEETRQFEGILAKLVERFKPA